MGIALEGSPPKWSSGTLSCSSPMPARPITHHSLACPFREWELRETRTRKGPEGPRRDDKSVDLGVDGDEDWEGAQGQGLERPGELSPRTSTRKKYKEGDAWGIRGTESRGHFLKQ